MAKKNKAGTVYLVGAGPGDPGLLTLRGASLLAQADVVIYDGLIHPRVLELSPQAKKEFAGKNPNQKGSISQDKINQLLLTCAKRYKKSVRLKGGDPFVFGRGGEEASFLKRNKIPFEVISGVSAGHAVPASAGIPITDRRLASQVTFVTANEDPEKETSSVEWEKIAKLSGTLVLFMGVRSLESVTRKLISFGKNKKTLVTVIQWGTLPYERVVEGTLESIAAKVRKAGLVPPAITVMGEVNRFRKTLGAFKTRPLQGKTVLVTRAASGTSELSNALESHGARVIEMPFIEILPPKSWKPLDEAIENQRQFDWALFTSAYGVRAFFERLFQAGKDVRALSHLKIGSVGEHTSQILKSFGVLPDIEPKIFTSEALFETLKKKNQIAGNHFLLPRTDIAPDFLREAICQAGGKVTEVTAYQTINPLRGARKERFLSRLRSGIEPDFITFTSASTVRHFFQIVSKSKIQNLKSKIVTIGPVTSQELAKHGLRSYRQAKDHSIPGLVKAILKG